MEFRQLGKSGLQVPVLCLGTGTFGGGNEFFKAWGNTDVTEATRLIDICMPRENVLISTKGTFQFGDGPNRVGSSRHHLTEQIEGSLKRLKTDYIDVYHMHGFDALTPVEETLSTLDQALQAGKIRYIAASNFSGWHIQKSLGVSDRYGWTRYSAHQVYYSLVGREYEWELMPQGWAEGVGALVWSPLGWGRLTGKIRRGQPLPEQSRLHKTAGLGPAVDNEYLYRVVDALDAVAAETGKTVPQVALNWLLRKPTIASVIIGARNEQQLRDNLAAAGFTLTAEQVAALDEASQAPVAYPYWHQRQFQNRNPLPPSYR
jgi:aryl-alcohol dehydrogenase-like predicted oxidoreductase